MSSMEGAIARRPARPDRKIYIGWIGVVWLAIIAGFGLDFGRYMAERPGPPAILHIHAAVYVVWLVLVSVQIFLVESGDIRRHKKLGWATAILSAVMVPLGLTAAFVDQARQVGAPDYAPQFLSLEFGEMIGFATFITAGILWRKNLAAHKRLMILSAVAISDAGFARLWLNGFKVTLPGPFGWWLQFYWGIALMLIAMMAWDWWKRGRVHPAVLGRGSAALDLSVDRHRAFLLAGLEGDDGRPGRRLGLARLSWPAARLSSRRS
jgi:hypothetical protein